MASSSLEKGYSPSQRGVKKSSSVLKFSLLATLSALAGGLATAWYYRDMLQKLQNPVNNADIHNSESEESEFTDLDR